jgi:hypothetical protein
MNTYQWISTVCVGLTASCILLVGQSNRRVQQLFSSPHSAGSVAIGMAEGTRSIDGGKTPYWTSHTDPGNQKRNQGTFSNQVDGKTAEEADQLQLERVRKFAEKISGQNPELTELELVSGADLYNQAPKAAATYLEKLAEAKKKGLSGEEAIVEARVKSFIAPNGKLDAPGLRNDMEFVKFDQSRRVEEINKGLKRN